MNANANANSQSTVIDADEVYQEALQELQDAYTELGKFTDNQQGMPGHLRMVASKFARVKELAGQLEKEAMRQAASYDEAMLGGRRGSRRKYKSTRKHKSKK